MTKQNRNFHRNAVFLFALLALCAFASLAQTAANIKLDVDATEAWRNVLRVRETMTVKPGRLTLVYPKFTPGEHAPTGTINDVVNFVVAANGKPLAWQRDDVEMFAFHLDVPAKTSEIEIRFDDVSQPNTIASARLSRIKRNRLVFYPRGATSGAALIITKARSFGSKPTF